MAIFKRETTKGKYHNATQFSAVCTYTSKYGQMLLQLCRPLHKRELLTGKSQRKYKQFSWVTAKPLQKYVHLTLIYERPSANEQAYMTLNKMTEERVWIM